MSAQALVAFRGNRYSVPPGLAGATVTVSHRLGEHTLDIAPTAHGGTVLARHRREPDGAGVLVRDTAHVTALETAVLAAFDSSTPCAAQGPPATDPGRARRGRAPTRPSPATSVRSSSTWPATPKPPATGSRPSSDRHDAGRR